MMDEAFKVERQDNTDLSTATVEQLNNEGWQNDFTAVVQTKMDEVNNKLTIQFV